MTALDTILAHDMEVLRFLKTRYPVHHASNIFFRDVQFGIAAFLAARGMKTGYTPLEGVTRRFLEQMERKKILRCLDHQTWVVTHEEFKTPVTKPAPAARPVPAAAPTAPAA